MAAATITSSGVRLVSGGSRAALALVQLAVTVTKAGVSVQLPVYLPDGSGVQAISGGGTNGSGICSVSGGNDLSNGVYSFGSADVGRYGVCSVGSISAIVLAP